MRVLRVLRSPTFWVILISMAIATVVNVGEQSGYWSSSSSNANAGDRPALVKMATEPTIMREGAAMNDIKGKFRKVGDRYCFTEDGSNVTYKCLENIGLQRVAASIQNEDRKLVWLITAKVTEFNEENFLLLEKAVRTR